MNFKKIKFFILTSWTCKCGNILDDDRKFCVQCDRERPFWEDSSEWIDMKVAQIRFDNQDKTFSLYYRDSNEKWHPYDELLISQNIEYILAEIDNDPTGIFWG